MHKLSFLFPLFGINSYLTLLALETTQGLEGVPDFAIAGHLVVLGGNGLVPIIRFSFGINSYLPLLALESTPGPEGAPDGQVLAITGPDVVLGGHGCVSIIRISLGIKTYFTLLVLE